MEKKTKHLDKKNYAICEDSWNVIFQVQVKRDSQGLEWLE